MGQGPSTPGFALGCLEQDEEETSYRRTLFLCIFLVHQRCVFLTRQNNNPVAETPNPQNPTDHSHPSACWQMGGQTNPCKHGSASTPGNAPHHPPNPRGWPDCRMGG